MLRLIASPMTNRLKHPIIAHGHPDRNKDNDERNNRMIDDPRERRFKSMARNQFEYRDRRSIIVPLFGWFPVILQQPALAEYHN